MVTKADGRAELEGSASATPLEVDPDLLAAARRALARHGPAGATLERIAEEAGLSRVTLYRRGLTRPAIIAALADDLLDAYRDALWPALTARGAAAERLRRALAAACDVAEEGRYVLLALAAWPPGEEALGAHRDPPAGSDFAEPVERLLRDGAADGSLPATDARGTAVALLTQVVWTYVHLRAGPRWSARRARGVTLELALHGVAAGPDGGRP